ncbi:hypothetical protein PAMP_002432 [Pampus punctatissimus]
MQRLRVKRESTNSSEEEGTERRNQVEIGKETREEVSAAHITQQHLQVRQLSGARQRGGSGYSVKREGKREMKGLLVVNDMTRLFQIALPFILSRSDILGQGPHEIFPERQSERLTVARQLWNNNQESKLNVPFNGVSTLSCYQCFVDVEDSLRLCWGHILTEHNVRNVDACFRKLDRIFNNNQSVIQAGRVGKGYDKQLKEILDAEILPMADEMDKQLNNDTLYEERLQTAADNFIAAASKLPRGETWSLPLSFIISSIKLNSVSFQQVFRVQVQFTTVSPVSMTPVNSLLTVQVKTQQVDQFKDVTAGVDRLYSIPSTSLQHQGTYQCEIFSVQGSITRLYYYLIGNTTRCFWEKDINDCL